MKSTLLIMVTALTMLSGCLFHGRPRPHDQRRARACPPSTHWDDGGCRSNGHGGGHGRGRGGDDHKRHD